MHLKVFCCKAFAHILEEQRQKLDGKDIPCAFLGYKDAEFGYKSWESIEKKLIKSSDIVFCKKEFFTDIRTLEKSNKARFVLSTILVFPSI